MNHKFLSRKLSAKGNLNWLNKKTSYGNLFPAAFVALAAYFAFCFQTPPHNLHDCLHRLQTSTVLLCAHAQTSSHAPAIRARQRSQHWNLLKHICFLDSRNITAELELLRGSVPRPSSGSSSKLNFYNGWK